MRLSDCEIVHKHMRGHLAVFIYGDRALTDDELVDIAHQYSEGYGESHRPAYVSPDGWQLLSEKPAPKAKKATAAK